MDSFLKRDIAVYDNLLKKKKSQSKKSAVRSMDNGLPLQGVGGPASNRGSRVADRTSDYSLEELGELYEKNDSKPFFKLDISREKINALISEIERNFEPIVIDKAKTMGYAKDVLKSELKELLDASVEKSLEEMDLYNDGSYIELPSYVAAISFLCQINDLWEEWIRLYEAMRVFPLKGALAYRIKTPQQCVEVLKNIHSGEKGKIDVKLFQYVFFHRTTESLANLHTLTESKILDPVQREKAEHLYKDLEENLSLICTKMLGMSLEDLGMDSTVTWVVGLRNRFINNPHSVNHYRMMVANVLFEELKKSIVDTDGNPSSFENNIFYLSITDKDDTEKSKSLIESLMEMTYSRYFNDIEPNEDGFEKLRTVYTHLPANIDETLAEIRKRQPRQEGYKTIPDSAGDFRRGNQFWLSVLFLQVESSENEDDFKKLVDIALKYACEESMTDAYLIPLYIAELIAAQVLGGCKDWYEERLICEFPDLVEVVRILTANGGEFSDHVRRLLRRRVEAEWALEMECKPFFNKDTLKFLENYLWKAGITPPPNK